jgi:hypothetical protein
MVTKRAIEVTVFILGHNSYIVNYLSTLVTRVS